MTNYQYKQQSGLDEIDLEAEKQGKAIRNMNDNRCHIVKSGKRQRTANRPK